MKTPSEAVCWERFCQKQPLTGQQQDQFLTYLHLIQQWNKKINLTRLSSCADICTYHFQDSLVVERFIDMGQIKSLGDIGTGAGLPGIPLKIKYPHLTVILLEVIGKKITFLTTVIQELGLTNIEVVPLDWRTFLRTTHMNVDLFCARASLEPKELIRLFKPSSPYHTARLVYWAPRDWQPAPFEQGYIEKEEWYQLNNARRRLLFFTASAEVRRT